MAINPYMQQSMAGYGSYGQGGMQPIYNTGGYQSNFQGFQGIPNSFNGMNNLPMPGGSGVLASMFGSPTTNAGVDPLFGRLPSAASGTYSMLMAAVGGVLPFAAPNQYQVDSLPPLLGGLSIFGIGDYYRQLANPMPFATPSYYGSPSYSNALSPFNGNQYGSFNNGGNSFYGQGYGLGQGIYG